MYYYRQSLAHVFADSLLIPVSHLLGAFGTLQIKPLTLGFEAFPLHKQLAKAIRVEQQQKDFMQAFHYIYRPETQPLSYSKTLQIFGQKTAKEELSWDIRYKQSSGLTLTSRIAMVKDLSAITDIHWNERVILSAYWHNQSRTAGITYYRFRKDAVPALDTLYSEFLPVQNRIKGSWKQDITEDLSYSINCQYQHYRDNKLSKNGISFNQSFDYTKGKLDCSLALLIWANQKNLYQDSELLYNDDYLAQSDTDTAFRVSVKYLMFNNYRLILQAYRPNHYITKQSYNFSLSASF
jgi:hypothetical protein